ncbi:MAG: phosphoribosyltransferase [Actinomycetota bacterium]
MFRDRPEAGERLADALAGRNLDGPVVVLAVPRGGVVVAVPVARRLGAPLDVVIPHKLGAPDNPELAVGAVAPGVRVLDDALIARLGIDRDYLDEEVARQEDEIARRTKRYRAGRAAPDLRGTTTVIVDDGVATGATAVAALRWARSQHPAKLVFAVPVGPSSTMRRLEHECDAVVVLETPRVFYAVGEWYREFGQVTDDEVLVALGALGGEA